jgi:hypothetical protein
MGRLTPYLLVAGLGVAVLGCSDGNDEPSPTSPDLAPSTTGCDIATARGVVSSIFPTQVRQTAKQLLQAIQEAGPGTPTATEAGFDLLSLVASYGPANPPGSSTFVNAVIPCQNVGPVALPINFAPALSADGAFEVRGSSGDKAAAVSHDLLWGLEPPFNISVTPAVKRTWNEITTPGSSEVTTQRFLVYGMPVSIQGFTKETLVGTVFEWATIPTLNFAPGVVVGTCLNDGSGSEYLIQHHAAANGGEIVPSATPSFCPAAPTGLRAKAGWSLSRVAHELFNLFQPRPLLASALVTRPPGGSIGNLSPSAAINPGQIALEFGGTIADGKTGVPLTLAAPGSPPITVSVRPGSGLTPMDGVHVRLIATTNLGATVVATGNTATTQDGIATFPNLRINKAGGYRLIATLDGFGQNSTAGFQFNNKTSNGFNLKQSR